MWPRRMTSEELRDSHHGENAFEVYLLKHAHILLFLQQI